MTVGDGKQLATSRQAPVRDPFPKRGKGFEGMKFDMGWTTLSTLTQQSQGSSDDLSGLIQALIAAAAPLEGTFNGNGRAMFDNFKSRSDQVTADLNAALGAIVTGQSGMDTAFVQGDEEMASNATASQGSANFDAARFGARGLA